MVRRAQIPLVRPARSICGLVQRFQGLSLVLLFRAENAEMVCGRSTGNPMILRYDCRAKVEDQEHSKGTTHAFVLAPWFFLVGQSAKEVRRTLQGRPFALIRALHEVIKNKKRDGLAGILRYT